MFNIKDCPGSLGQNLDASIYNQDFDGILVFLDLTSKDSHLNFWYSIVQTIRIKRCAAIPIVICGNKCDTFNCKGDDTIVAFTERKRIPYFMVSALTLFNFIKPFDALASAIFQLPNFHLYEHPLLMEEPKYEGPHREEPKYEGPHREEPKYGSPEYTILNKRLVSIAPSRFYLPELSLCRSDSFDLSNEVDPIFALET
jgi:GTPase SAR1 family protein